MAKITNKERLEMWEKWREGEGTVRLSQEYGIDESKIRYLVRLIERHGPDILRQGKNRKYSKELKEEMICKVLQENQSVKSTAIEYGLSSDELLTRWIRSYKENGYVILEKKKGRQPMKKKEELNKPLEEMTPEEQIEYWKNRAIYAEAEAEYLKKLHAVVQARKARQQKKK
ncbi:MAG: transposase [Oscillospiraceae bacterium]|nr:transposase [Oscillospiraceae bacterium]